MYHKNRDHSYIKNFPLARLAVSLLSLLLLISPRPLFSQDSSPASSDFNGNGIVDIQDFLLFVDAFGTKKDQDRYDAKYDLDENGEIGISDFLIFVDSFGQTVTREPTAPVLAENNFMETTRGPENGVNVSVVDVEGFSEGTHGQRITDTFLKNTNRARLVQIGGLGIYQLNGLPIYGINSVGYIRHVLERDGGIFWTASDDAPEYSSDTASQWFIENDRPFTPHARAFATWMQHQNTLFISSLENSTSKNDGSPLYCDDYDQDAEYWIPICGEIDDYIAHSGTGLANTVFVGGIQQFTAPGLDDLARGAIRADGVFASHTIYVESPDGSTSHATPVLAAYATNLSFGNPTWGAVRLKQELMKLARAETIEYDTGGFNEQGTLITETRTIKSIRPAFAPGVN